MHPSHERLNQIGSGWYLCYWLWRVIRKEARLRIVVLLHGFSLDNVSSELSWLSLRYSFRVDLFIHCILVTLHLSGSILKYSFLSPPFLVSMVLYPHEYFPRVRHDLSCSLALASSYSPAGQICLFLPSSAYVYLKWDSHTKINIIPILALPNLTVRLAWVGFFQFG